MPRDKPGAQHFSGPIMGNVLTGGQGTPWGPTEFGRPNTPAYESYDTDISHFMNTPQIQQAANDAALQGGNAERGYLAAQSKMLGSGTSSGSQQGALANIAAQNEKNKNALITGLAQTSMDAYNRARQARNDLLSRQYGIDLGAYGNEQNARGEAIGSLLGGLGKLGGTYWGSQLGKPANPDDTGIDPRGNG